MTRWHRARNGQIYIQDSLGQWHWVTPAHTRRSMHRLLCVIMSVVFTLLLSAALLLAFGWARVHAEGLPQYNVSCNDIVLMAHKFRLHDTTAGRVKAKIIAGTLGIWLTDEELEKAAKCLPVTTPKKDKEKRHDG